VSQFQRLIIIISVITYVRYFFLHIVNIPLYFEFFIFIFNANWYRYSRNYFLTTAYEIATSFITEKWRHPKRAVVQHATRLAPPCQMKFPTCVKHTKTPVCYARNHSLHHLHKSSIGLNYCITYPTSQYFLALLQFQEVDWYTCLRSIATFWPFDIIIDNSWGRSDCSPRPEVDWFSVEFVSCVLLGYLFTSFSQSLLYFTHLQI
jgi:hypothetical protein